MSQIFYFVLSLYFMSKNGHASLGLEVKNLHTKFQNHICNSKGDNIVQKNNMENKNFAFFTPYLSEEKLNFHSFHIIR